MNKTICSFHNASVLFRSLFSIYFRTQFAAPNEDKFILLLFFWCVRFNNKKGRKCALAHTARTVRGDIDHEKSWKLVYFIRGQDLDFIHSYAFIRIKIYPVGVQAVWANPKPQHFIIKF